MTHILSRDYGISISSGRVYRLMRSMTLPKPSTVKPKRNPQKDSGECHDLLRRQFHQSAPNLVWVSDFTYLRVNRTWYFLCIVMDLFSRKIIGWSLSAKHGTALIIAAFHKAYQSRNISYGLIFHSDQGRSIPLLLSVSFWMQTILSSRSPRKDVRLTMPVVNRSLSS